MGLTCRKYLLDRDNTLWLLPSTKFDQMLRDPASHVISIFAGQRVRMADLVVELVNRVPVRVVRSTFAMLEFDHKGCIASEEFESRQAAIADTAISHAFISVNDSHEAIVEASTRFIARGGQWIPSSKLALVIYDAALGHRQCKPLTS